MNHPINSLIGGPSTTSHGNGLTAAASATAGTGPGPGPGGGGTNTSGTTGAGLPLQHMFGSFDANMDSSVTLACCQSLCDVLTELPLPTAVQDKSSHTRSLITGLNVNMTSARNTLLNDLTMVPQIQQALLIAKQHLSDVTFHLNHSQHHNSSTSPASGTSNTQQSPSSDQQTVTGGGPSPSHHQQPSQLLHELLARGCFLNSQLSVAAAAASSTPSSTSSAATTPAAIAANVSSIYPSSTTTTSSSSSAVAETTSANSSTSNDLYSQHHHHHHNQQQQQNLHSHQQQQQQHSSVLTGSHQGHDLLSNNNNNEYSQMNHHHHQQQQPQYHQQQQQQRTNIHHHQQQQQPHQDVNNTIKIESENHTHHTQQQQYLQQQQQLQNQNQNYSSLGERVKSRQRDAAAKAIQANAAAFATNQQQQQPPQQQQPYNQQQMIPNNNNSQAMIMTNDSISDTMYNNNSNSNSMNQMPTTRTMAAAAAAANIKNEYGTQSSSSSSIDDKEWQLHATSSSIDDKDWQLPATSQRKSSTTSTTTTTPATINYNRKPLYQQPPARPKIEMVKPQIRSVKYQFTDIDNDAAFLSKSVDIVVRFEQIIDQILQTSCNDFNDYYSELYAGDVNTGMGGYNDTSDNDYYNSGYENNNNNNQYQKYHHHQQQQQQHNRNSRNTNKRIKSGFDIASANHLNGMSFNVSIDSDQLKEIMILSAKLKQTNRIGEIERKKLILFLTVLSNQLNIWLTRYKSKSSVAAMSSSHGDSSTMNNDNDDDENVNERQHYWELCCNASQSALHLMTSTSGQNQSSFGADQTQLISLEELIEVIVDFLSNNLSAATHVTTSTTKSSKSKSSSSSSYHQYQHFGVSKRHVTRWTQLLQLLFEFINLRTKGSLTDTLILSLTRISMSALFLLQNTAEMQFVSIEILCHVFEEYQKHRISILEELLNSLSKIPTKKSHRKDSVLTQMLIRLTNAFFQPNTTQTHTRDSLTKQSTAALQIISSFLSHFLRKCHNHSSGGGNSDVDFKLIFESLLNDLLDQLHSPHQTASILIVQVIIKLLISYLAPQQQNKSQTSSLAARLLAIEYLSIVCSKFAQFLAEKDETIKELQTTFSTIEQEPDVKPIKKNRNREKQQQQQQQELEQKQKDGNFVVKVYNYLIDYFNSEKLYREKLCLGSIWIKDRYFTENEQNEQDFLQKLNQSKFNDDSGSVVAISTAALCIQYMEFVHFSTNSRLFDISISHVTASLSNTSNTTQRSRAMKCLSNILSSSTIDRATQLLSRSDLQNAMRSALLDPSTSVREATVDLIGRFVLQSKDQNLVQRYSDLIGDRILDTGISVRKRVIKILRDFCIEFPEYEKCGEMAVKIVRRINDDGEGIRRLVVDTCRDLWFTNTSQITPIKFKVYSLLHVIANMINDNASMESMQSLFDQLIKSDTMLIAQQICDSIMNDVLIDDMPQSTKKTQLSAVQCVAMMSQCCPELMVKHCDTLQSLMSLPCETLIEISLRMKVIQTIERVLPHIHNPSPYLLTRIEEDLTKNILQSSANIIQCSVKCLSVLIKNHTKNTKLAVELFCKFQQILYQYRNLLYDGHNQQQVKPKLLRAIFTCGLFAKFFSIHIYEYKDRVRDTFIELIISPYDVDIKCKSIVALGFIIESDPKICLLPNVIEIYTRILRNEYSENASIQSTNRKNDELFCIQVLNNFRNYLSESIESDENAVKTIEWARESLKSMQSSEDDSGSTQSQIIQKYLSSILINALNPNLSIRRVACNVIHVIHSGGHVHPLQLVPHLVAMTCDDDYQIRVRADHVLHDIERKYHGYVAMKAKEAVQLSALFCKKLNCSGFRIYMEKSSTSAAATQDGQTLISMPTTTKEICSRLSTLYQVICTNRQSRRGFITSLLRHFDTSEFVVKTINSTNNESTTTTTSESSLSSSSMKPELIDIEFFVESILFFPYTVFDEILYILNQLECTLSINSTHVTQLFKEIFTVERSQSSSSEQQQEQQNPVVSQHQQFINNPSSTDPLMQGLMNQQPQIIYDHMGNAQMIYHNQPQMMMNPYQQSQQQQQQQPPPPQSNVIDIEEIDLENEDQFKKYENNIHVNFDLLLSDRSNERLINIIRSLRTIYLSTLLRTLLKEFYLLKDEKINDYSTNDAKTWEKPVHRRQIESLHLKELFNLAKPNIEMQESLLLSNDLQSVEKQLLNEWKRFRQVSMNNYDPNFKPLLLTKLFQFGSSKSTSSVQAIVSSNVEQRNRTNDDQQSQQSGEGMTNCVDSQNMVTTADQTPNKQQQQQQQQRHQQSAKMNNTNSNKRSKQSTTKKKRKRIVMNDDSDESSSEVDDDDDEDYQQGF
ncbi:nipped-B cohesin loading factor [Dermatophagoides farinae]|uniref:nipped-B cohesin loading factor n=1 Tax=Dermatophagoides farinae TaxID=6954 RepID=UPI003F5F0031